MRQTEEQAIARHLDGGERLLWCGRPGGGIRFRRADWFMVPFSLAWGGFAIFWESMALRDQGNTFFRLWGIPFVAAGLYLIAGRFVWDAYRRGHTTYGVTDRRVVFVTGRHLQQTTTLPLRTIPAITVAERSDGSGDVVFDAAGAQHVAIGGLVPKGSDVPAMFEFIPRAREVYDVIREAQRHAV